MTAGMLTDLLVLGAGPAGMACAYQAAKDGMDVVLVDRQSEPFRVHAGIAGVLHDTSMPFEFDESTLALGRGLSLSLEGHISKRASRLTVSAANGRFIYDHGRPFQYYTDLGRVLGEYWSHIAQEPRIRVLTDHSLAEFSSLPSGVLASALLSGPDGELRLSAKSYVLADGINSPSLRKLGIRGPGFGRAIIISQWFQPRSAKLDPRDLEIYFGEPFLPDTRSLGLVIPFTDRVQVSTLSYLGTGEKRAGLKDHFDSFARRVLDNDIHTAISPSAFNVDLDAPLASPRVAENAFAVGDAAWSVECYFRGAIEMGSGLGSALAAAHCGDLAPLGRYEDWYSGQVKGYGFRELNAILALATLGGAKDGVLSRLHAALVRKPIGPYKWGAQARTVGALAWRALTVPAEMLSLWRAYRSAGAHTSPSPCAAPDQGRGTA